MTHKERISATYGITKNAVDTDAETIRKVEAVVYIMAEKFLETAEMEQLRKEITMTKLGQMIFNDGKQDQLITLVKKKLARGLSVADIADAVEESVERVTEIIAEINA